MPTDPWGVDDGYEDTDKKWRPTDPNTHKAILTAMGVENANAVPPDEAPVCVVHPGTPSACPVEGTLKLEDGGEMAVRDRFPRDLPLGYHELLSPQRSAPLRVIAAPAACERPEPTWGWSVQLYSARSQTSWGMGDLGDLGRLGQWARTTGAGLLLVNPLAAAAPMPPQEPSPYYPSSRRFLNPLYLRVEDVPGAGRLGADLEKVAAEGRRLNENRIIDRDAVLKLKTAALRALWATFPGDADFDRFCQQRGQELDLFAAWCALAERHGVGDWRRWPAEHQRPDSPAVAQFVVESAREVAYHRWLQWLLDRQLAAAAGAIPLVQDLPIGVDPGGADAWAWQDLLAKDCTVGAPPDNFNSAGQDWSLPPLVPHKLRAAGYEPFVQTIRGVLRHARGLRIDHVMGMFRLYWIPKGFGPQRGAYVRYRFDELLAIVALESRRASAFVVGEDLGTVEPKVRDELRRRKILSFRVLWFEKRPTKDYPKQAMTTATTHDLSTVAGLWCGSDVAEQAKIDAQGAAATAKLRGKLAREAKLPPEASPAEAVEGAYRALGKAPSLILMATLEDALAVEERPNLPGTTGRQRPNWSLALPGGIEAVETAQLPRKIAAALNRT